MRASSYGETDLGAPSLAASEAVKVGVQPLAWGVFGSHGGSASRPVLLPEPVLAPGPGTRYDALVRSGVSEECDFLLTMWRDAVRSLSVDAAAYESVLGALPINATMCEYMKLVAVVGSTLLRKCGGDVGYLVSAVGLSFFTSIYRRGSCSALVPRGKRVSTDIAFVAGAFPWRPGRRGAGRRFESRKSLTATILAPSHTQRRSAPRLFRIVVNGRALALKRAPVSDIRTVRVSPLGAVGDRKLRITHD